MLLCDQFAVNIGSFWKNEETGQVWMGIANAHYFQGSFLTMLKETNGKNITLLG